MNPESYNHVPTASDRIKQLNGIDKVRKGEVISEEKN